MDGSQTGCGDSNELPRPRTADGVRSPRPRRYAATLEPALPLIEGGSVLLSSVIADLLLPAASALQASTPVWDFHLRWAASAAVIAPFVMRSQQRIGAASASVLRSFVPQFSAFAAIVLAIGWLDGSLMTIAPSWTALWMGLTLLLLLTLRANLVLQPRRETIAIVGAGPIADLLVSALASQARSPVDLVGVFDDRTPREAAGSLRRDGSVADLLEYGKKGQIDTILLALPGIAVNRVGELVHELKALAVPVGLCPHELLVQNPQNPVGYAGKALPYALLADRPIRRWGIVIKAVEDYVLASLALLLLSPLLIAVALAVRLSGPGPVLFRQPRHAWNNAEFQIYKFRTMRWDPEAQHRALVQTQTDDARITPVGRFLRRTSLDELPQLLNVLRGDMSLVGPRPHAVDMRTENLLGNQIIRSYAHRHRVKPGITGLAQVNGYRGATYTADALRRRVEYDLEYIDHWSVWLDLKILVRTVLVVLRGTNAY